MYSGEYDACDVTLSVYPHRASLKNMPDHGGNRTYELEPTRPRSSVGRALGWYSKGRRFDSHRGQAYFSSLPGVDIHQGSNFIAAIAAIAVEGEQNAVDH